MVRLYLKEYIFNIQELVFLHIDYFNLQVVELDVKVEEPGNENVHNNAFYAEETLLKSELEAIRDCNSACARHWIVSSLTFSNFPFFFVSQVFLFSVTHTHTHTHLLTHS